MTTKKETTYKSVKTADGSNTLFSFFVNEHYHSINGAIQESEHIFINSALKQCKKKNIHIFEIGFGTGLNAFLSFLYAKKEKIHITYTTIELYPIDEAQIKFLNYAELLSPEHQSSFESLHTAKWGEQIVVNEFFKIKKILADFTTFENDDDYDVVFFDAFSPEKQPEMWTLNCFEKLYQHIHKNGVLTTYCAKGDVRRSMQQAGFVVERIPGPVGKREILRARK
jgi:tRNA U34 5-methylaminomethyl-2-thiouridine-forming methyltransferase MnmC